MATERLVVVATADEAGLVDSGDVVVTGVGAANTIRSLSGIGRDTPLLNVGYAGSNVIRRGERVSVGRVSTYHPTVEYDEPTFDLGGDVPCYTSTDFVTSTTYDEPCVFDMELAYILAMGFTDVVSVKVVSDNLSVEEYEGRSDIDGRES